MNKNAILVATILLLSLHGAFAFHTGPIATRKIHQRRSTSLCALFGESLHARSSVKSKKIDWHRIKSSIPSFANEKQSSSLPKWFRALLVGSKVSSLLNFLPQQGDDITKNEEEEDAWEETQPPQHLPGSRLLRLLMSSPLVEFKLSLLVLISSVFVAVGTVKSVPLAVHNVIDFSETIISTLFLMEYVLRWYCNDLKIRHLFKPLVIVDFLSILPLAIKIGFYSLPFGSKILEDNLLVNLRLLRLLRFQRFLVDVETFERFQSATGIQFFSGSSVRRYHLQLARVIISIFTVQTVSAGLIYAAERVVNPTLRDFPSAMYFVLTTVTTVGFGDITPVTAVGRMIVSATILIGAVIIPLQITQFVEALLEFRRDLTAKSQKKKRKKNSLEENSMSLDILQPTEGVAITNGNTKALMQNNRICQSCHAYSHHGVASFCWNCGSPLQTSVIEAKM